MATIVNDRDVLLQAGTRDADPRANKYIKISSDALYFHLDKDGAPSQTVINISAQPINISGGTPVFTVSAGSLTNVSGNTCQLAFENMPVGTVTVTASITDQGQTYTDKMTISKLQDGVIGNDGAPGAQYATAYLYKWSSANPGQPNGTSTLSWSLGSKNTSYLGSDGWYITPPANPGGSLVQLWVAAVAISAPGGTPTSTVSYTSSSVYAITQNGAPGAKYQIVRAYQWSTGATPTAAGTAAYTWSTNDYDTVPTGWAKLKPVVPVLGATLYEASVAVQDASGSATTNFDWGTASISSVGYAGANGSSSTIAYVLVDGSSLNTTPAQVVTAGTAFPATGSWGETRAWTTAVPIPSAGQSVFQTNGTYNPSANDGAGQTTWSVPYMSNFRVGSLSALVVNTGNLTISGIVSSANGSFSVDQTGAATMTAVTIKTPGGTVLLSSGVSRQITSTNVGSWFADGAITDTYIGGDLKSTNWNSSTGVNGTGWLMQRAGNLYANSVTLRGAIMSGAYTGYAWPAAGAGGGFYLGPSGLLLGSANDGKYFQVDNLGNVYSPQFSIVNGVATFAGTLSAPTMNGGTITGTTIQSATSGARVVMSGSNLSFYGNAGAGVEQTVSIGGSDGSIWCGSATAGSTTNGISARAYTGYGINSYSVNNVGVYSTGGWMGVWGRGNTGPGVLGQADGGSYAVQGTGGSNWCFYAQRGTGGTYGPFTGGHDALCGKADTFAEGDIVVDEVIVNHHDVSNTIAKIALSSRPLQKTVVGVFVNRKQVDVDSPPAAFDDYSEEQMEVIAAEYDLIAMNSLGEGMVNVCGENGDIEAGDYITTSSIPGKGMRQADDLLHNYTVAKARESVKFSSPDEVKMIACTYHCG